MTFPRTFNKVPAKLDTWTTSISSQAYQDWLDYVKYVKVLTPYLSGGRKNPVLQSLGRAIEAKQAFNQHKAPDQWRLLNIEIICHAGSQNPGAVLSKIQRTQYGGGQPGAVEKYITELNHHTEEVLGFARQYQGVWGITVNVRIHADWPDNTFVLGVGSGAYEAVARDTLTADDCPCQFHPYGVDLNHIYSKLLRQFSGMWKSSLPADKWVASHAEQVEAVSRHWDVYELHRRLRLPL